MTIYKSLQFLMLPKQNIALQILHHEANVYHNNKIQTTKSASLKIINKDSFLFKARWVLILQFRE